MLRKGQGRISRKKERREHRGEARTHRNFREGRGGREDTRKKARQEAQRRGKAEKGNTVETGGHRKEKRSRGIERRAQGKVGKAETKDMQLGRGSQCRGGGRRLRESANKSRDPDPPPPPARLNGHDRSGMESRRRRSWGRP